MADPVNYREMSEVEEWRINDPIDRFKALALGEGLITPVGATADRLRGR